MVDRAAVAWRRRRSEFTHDWLRNRFLPRLHASALLMARGIRGAIGDLPDLMLEWPARSAEVEQLADVYCAVMSPLRAAQSIAGSWPRESAEFIRRTAVECWRRRHRIDARLAEIHAAHRDADRSHARWQADDASALISLAEDCERLIRALSNLPSNVRL